MGYIPVPGYLSGPTRFVAHSLIAPKLVKIGAKIVTHARYVTFQAARVAVPSHLFGEILKLINGPWPRPAPERP